ncbi:hypothetical protein [Kitasatospora griseola]|uniref:hypothetical protein n=1 Tax=Kitasatospora griseola TaxID=2064 RepID=UPI00365338FC
MTTARDGGGAAEGGVDLTISLTPAQAAALGAEARQLADWFGTALTALATLRTGQDPAGRPHPAGPADWHTAIRELDHRLLPRLGGIRDAAIRAHAAAGGSIGDLATAMHVARSTAQYRREALLGRVPDTAEHWAAHGGEWGQARTHTADVVTGDVRTPGN